MAVDQRLKKQVEEMNEDESKAPSMAHIPVSQ